jgi:hypothetical protein
MASNTDTKPSAEQGKDPKLTPQDQANKVSQETAEASKQEQADKAAADAEKAANQEPTTVLEAKSPAALADPSLDVGDHFAQRFANQPENPQPAPGLREVEDKDLVRLEITDSDHPDPANPKVTYVHPEMVGDYLRAGWRQPSV